MSVDILMATHNGERFLRNQLLSLQQQTYEDWTLWVRDDGSTDSTLSIIEQFARADSRIKVVQENAGRRLGAGRNFLGLTRFASAEYAIFCDQDDIWFEKKLEELVCFADRSFDREIPSLVYCDGHIYSNEQGIIIANTISRIRAQDLRGFLFPGGGHQGCSMLVNRRLYTLAANYRADFCHMHDAVVSLLAHTFGVVHFISKPLMLYRQHDKNVVGAAPLGWRATLKRALSLERPVIYSKHYQEIDSFYRAYAQDMSREARELFEAYLRYPTVGMMARLGIIFKYGFSYGGNRLNLIAKTCIRKPIG